MGHSVEPYTSISIGACVVVGVAAVIVLLRGPLTRRRVGSALLAAAFACAGVWLLLDILSIGVTVGWDLTQGIGRGRLTGTAPAWSSILVEAILGPVFLVLGLAAARGMK